MILTKKVRLIVTDETSKLYQAAGVAHWAYNYTLRMQEMNPSLRWDVHQRQ